MRPAAGGATDWRGDEPNAVNLLDGIDGLAAGAAVIVSASVVVYGIVHCSTFAVIRQLGWPRSLRSIAEKRPARTAARKPAGRS